jgi:hypothetical protein
MRSNDKRREGREKEPSKDKQSRRIPTIRVKLKNMERKKKSGWEELRLDEETKETLRCMPV